MKNLALLLTALLMINSLYSRRYEGNNNIKENTASTTKAAGCAPAVAIAELRLNNVRTRIEGTGGSMWQDRSNGMADYEVPRRSLSTDPKQTAIYAGALWMGGQDVNGQLKIAAVTFRANGNDFWPGPLNETTAEIDAQTCSAYDQFYGVSKAMVSEYNAWYECTKDPSCDASIDFPGYSIPNAILNWPAHGDLSKGQEWNLAPFFDRDEDGFYDPTSGDYPLYDLHGNFDCTSDRDARLYGDTTIWFVFNDKGNTHSESQGPSIGMEIRAQAFAFATNDEVNDMTFYNYEMINRSTFTLTETYFGQWVDADLGGSTDDYVGCDAQRGLGYCYNGDADDEGGNGVIGYGKTPPAIGVDFFEGPYADSDGIDNPLTQNISTALAMDGIPYKGLGIGYGDTIVDNERYGMRKFVYYSIGNGQHAGDGDPSSALDHYNYLRGKWRNGGANMVWGGNGNAASSPGATVLADLLFPGDSDPLFWSTQGVAASPVNWSEAIEGNPPGDRRFLQSAGPFTLEPGAINDLTVGVVYARAISGDNLASISNLRVADDKAQALFDNCFKIAEGPDAPDVTFQELDKELIIYLSNRKVSNNYNESYNQKNPFIAIPDTMDGIYQGTDDDKDTLKFYEFQGYQVYQVKNGLITVGELDNPDVSRLVAQVDIKDGITQLVNFTFDENLQANVPQEMVVGADEGIKHSFRFTEDKFATGDLRLVNHKTYYYIATAYGYNEFKKYNPLSPTGLKGQKLPYIGSRKMAGGQGIRSFSAIPHNPVPENGGTIANSQYGDMPQITRLEGQGNGGNNLELTAASEAVIVSNNFMDHPVYKTGKGPIQVKVIDPLMVQAGIYRVQFKDTLTPGDLTDASWTLRLPNGIDTINSDQTIMAENEQLFLNQGISISIKQVDNPSVNKDLGNGVIGSGIEYEEPTLNWLSGFTDTEGQSDANWIRAGTSTFGTKMPTSPFSYIPDPFDDYYSGSVGNASNPAIFHDPEQNFEGLISGTWAPYRLVSSPVYESSNSLNGIKDALGYTVAQIGTNYRNSVKYSDLSKTPSVDIIFTNDKNKWSRCVILESRNDAILSEGNVNHLQLRAANSVDKNGVDDGTGTGMGWFPGYAINVETGERLNVAFAEDSWLAGENGKDMIWNPTSTTTAGVNNELVMGGKHYVYVFRSDVSGTPAYPAYDECAFIYNQLSLPIVPLNILNAQTRSKVFEKTCVWAGIPMLADGHVINPPNSANVFETDAKVKLRVEKPYKNFTTASLVNASLPYYQFDMTGFEVETGVASAMDSALVLINVVPNPYYSYSEYETGQLDNRIKIVNLPEICTISIYNVSGTLMRRFQKDNSKTSLDWNLKNHVNIPVASGVYLIHVDVPDIGQRTLKWYGVMKPTDLNGF
ncbi:MAG: hypothetical protein COB15_13010 [Flavobacteriales bacterium]|nr:MAG: hypothetical protein COB15_13010 [Flavobacteriales bacterium]